MGTRREKPLLDGSQSLRSAPRGSKYRVLAERLREQIIEGGWPVGSRLPTEPELARHYQVGVNTVRRAVSDLVDGGLLHRRQGSGTFVVDTPWVGSRKVRFVGVLVPSSSYIYPRVVAGIERVMTANGVRVILASSEYDLDLEAAQLHSLLGTELDGLLLVPNLHIQDEPQRYVDSLRQLPVPYVLVERRPPDPAWDDATWYVCTNYAAGAYAAVRHLVELGHERIGHLGRLRTGSADQVAEGFNQAVTDFGLAISPATVVRHAEWDPTQIAEYARTCRDNKVTAVFSLGDREAAALLPHARRLGMTVPDDLAVISYDDEVADLAEVPLTAVSPPRVEIGRLAAEMLLRRIDRGASAPAHQVQLQPRLVIRASCGSRGHLPSENPAENATSPADANAKA